VLHFHSYFLGYKTWALFDGTAEAYVHTTLIKKCDICGGRMTQLNGLDPINYSCIQVSLEHFYARDIFLGTFLTLLSRYDTDTMNRGGMIASLHKYDLYQDALKDAFGV